MFVDGFHRQLPVLLASVAVLTFVGGCSHAPQKVTVSGKVIYQGQPVVDAGVSFVDLHSGFTAVAALADDGTYQTESAIPVGAYQVSLVAKPKVPGGQEVSQGLPDYIDKSFSDPNNSGLVPYVTPTDDVFDFDVSAPLPENKRAFSGTRRPPQPGKPRERGKSSEPQKYPRI